MCSSTESSETLIINDIDIVANNDIPDENISDKILEVPNKTEIDEEKSFSDLDSIFDTPKKAKLRRNLRRKILLEKKHRLKIKSLRQKNQRLKKKITSFKQVIGTLKKERYIDNDMYNILRSNVFAADLYVNMKKKN